MTAVAIGISVLCLLAGIAIVVLLVRDQQAGERTINVLLLVEALLVVHAVLGTVRLVNDGEGVSTVTYLGYLLAVLAIIPVGFLWSASEKSRGGTAVLLVAVLLVPFLLLRTSQVWSGA